MNPKSTDGRLTFSITLPAVRDINATEKQLQNIFSVLDNLIPKKYELLLLCPSEINQTAVASLSSVNKAVKIIPVVQNANGDMDWQESLGDVLMVVDGDLSKPATALLDVVKNLESGSDMALLTHYTNSKDVKDPVLTCFAIKRDSLKKIKRDSEGYRLLSEVFGHKNLKKIMGNDDVANDKSGLSHFFSGLRSLVGVAK
jgi:hypothetical protein